MRDILRPGTNSLNPTHAPSEGIARSAPFPSRERGFWPICPYRLSLIFTENLTLAISLVLLLLSLSTSLYTQSGVTYTPLPVGEHWSRRVVSEDGAKRFYYRPDRFEFMEIYTAGVSELQLRCMLTEPATEVAVLVVVDGQESRHTLGVVNHDDRYYYTKPLNIKLTQDAEGASPFPTQREVEKVKIYTRNPFAYFRGYSVKTPKPRMRTSVLTPIAFWNNYQLVSPRSNSEYFSGNNEHILKYRAEDDGDVYFFIRAIRDGRKGVTVDIVKNDVVIQTTVLPNKTSKDYKIGEQRVTTGTKIELPGIKTGDEIIIMPKTEHEIITRMFITKRVQ